MDVDRAFAARARVAGVPAAFGEFAAPDGAMLSGQPGIVYGADAIRSTLAANFPANGRSSGTRPWGMPPRAAISASPWESRSLTRFSKTARRGSRYSKYLTVWRRLDAARGGTRWTGGTPGRRRERAGRMGGGR
jgi:hypothetical protein